jgi:hypothetical protein
MKIGTDFSEDAKEGPGSVFKLVGEVWKGEKMNDKEPNIIIISGSLFADDRPTSFPYGFSIKRFYQVTNVCRGFIRAFHGHRMESKCVWVSRGSILLYYIPIGEVDSIKHLKKCVLSAADPRMLYIPPGYYHGFKSLEEHTDVIFFSDKTTEESKGDDIRLSWDAFCEEIWRDDYR